MKKLISAVLALALGAGMLAGCGGNANTGSSAPDNSAAPGGTSSSDTAPAGDKTLNLYTWQGMFPQEVLDGFTQETGIAINYANFDTDENMLARLEAAGGGDYDVVIADDYIIQTVIAEGLAQKLDTAKLANWGNIDPVFQGQFYDPTNEYTVPYGSGVQTIVYNPALVQKEITGYGDLWDESLKDNLAVIGNYRVVNGMALKVMGESYNTEDTATIEAAGKKLLELAPNIRLIKNYNVQDDLLSGEVGAAVMYTSQVTLAMLTDPMGAVKGLWLPYFRFWTAHPDETVFYHRFRDSSFFPKYDKSRDVAYFGTFIGMVRAFKKVFPSLDQINQDLLWLHVLTSTVMYAKYVVEGVLPNNEETEETVFRLLTTGLSGYLKKKKKRQ